MQQHPTPPRPYAMYWATRHEAWPQYPGAGIAALPMGVCRFGRQGPVRARHPQNAGAWAIKSKRLYGHQGNLKSVAYARAQQLGI